MATVAPFDDKITPSLQVADLLASITKDLFLAWMRSGEAATVTTTEKWQEHIESFGLWDKQHMIGTIRDPMASGINLIRQPGQAISRRERRRGKRAARVIWQ